ncbi:MAG TPA: hypothetical protein VFT55_10165 [Planctomycetota bacterium]|nr:hypothetical protein [Planctomycetota bacterium]
MARRLRSVLCFPLLSLGLLAGARALPAAMAPALRADARVATARTPDPRTIAQAQHGGQAGSPQPPLLTPAVNRYKLEPFHADFPVELDYPPHTGLDYDRTRRQILERLAANLMGSGRKETWQLATEFFWRAPDDAVEPLIEAMDRAFGKPGLADVVRNCVEAMGRMGREEFDSALQRAVEHSSDAVRQSAYAALAMSSKISTLHKMIAWFPHMDSRARQAFVRAARLRLGAEAVPVLKALMMAELHSSVRDQVLKETLQLPVADAAEVLNGRWPEAVAEFKAIIAGVKHAAGDGLGTAWLQDALQSEDIGQLSLAIRHCVYVGSNAVADPGVLRQPLLRATTHLRPEVRLEVAKVLTRVEGDDVADVYELLVGPDEAWEVRSIALRELTRRGRPKVVTVLLEEAATATGTRLQRLLSELAASNDGRAVPMFVERYHKAPPIERRPFLQALAANHSKASVHALFALFTGPEEVVAKGASGTFTTRTYIPTLMLNLRGVELEILAAAAKLPAEDWRSRAALLPTLAGLASDRTDKELQEACLAPVRAVLFDTNELPQMRVLALNLLARRWLTIDEVLRIKSMRLQEKPGMRVLLTDFLNDSF